jgi:hypothetical protein
MSDKNSDKTETDSTDDSQDATWDYGDTTLVDEGANFYSCDSPSSDDDNEMDGVEEDNKRKRIASGQIDREKGSTSSDRQQSKKTKTLQDKMEGNIPKAKGLTSVGDKLDFLVEKVSQMSLENNERFMGIENKLDKIKKSIWDEVELAVEKAFETKLKNLNTRIEGAVEEQFKHQSEVVSEEVNSIVSKKISEMEKEMDDRSWRKSNFILYDVPESRQG